MIIGGKYTGPKLPTTYAVDMDAGATAGIVQPKNIANDLGASDFTLFWLVALPDYTPAAFTSIMSSRQNVDNRINFGIGTDGALGFSMRSGGTVYFSTSGGGTATASTEAIPTTNGDFAFITLSVVRESASTTGAITWGVGGAQLGDSISIAAATPVSFTNTADTNYFSDNSVSFDGYIAEAGRYNRALSPVEALDLYQNGPALADLNASQVPVYESDFSAGVDGWSGPVFVTLTGNVDGIDGQDDWLKVTRTSAGSGLVGVDFPPSSFPILKNTRTVMLLHNPAGSEITHLGIGGVGSIGVVSVPAGTTVLLDTGKFLSNDSGVYSVYARNSAGSATSVSNGQLFYVKSVSVMSIGVTLWLNAESIATSEGLTWEDSSGNDNTATLPASGAEKVSIRG